MKGKKPPTALPSQVVPIADPDTGIVSEAWYGYFADQTGKPTPFEELLVTASPFDFTAVHAGNVLIIGGTVSAVGLRRARVTIASVGRVAGFFPMSQNDVLTITYSVLPVVWFLPNGNPS